MVQGLPIAAIRQMHKHLDHSGRYCSDAFDTSSCADSVCVHGRTLLRSRLFQSEHATAESNDEIMLPMDGVLLG